MGKYLDEEKYQRSVKKLKGLALTILLIGLISGGLLIARGIILINTDTSTPFKDIEKKVTKTVDTTKQEEIKKQIEEVKEEIKKATDDLKVVKDELSNLEAKEKEFLENYANLPDKSQLADVMSQIATKSKEVSEKAKNELELEDKKNKLESELKSLDVKEEIEEKSNTEIFGEDFTRNYRIVKYSWYFGLGGFIIIASLMISGFIYLNAKRREINAFVVQGHMPIVKESAEELGPTARNVSREITRGIKEGLEDEENE